MCFFKKDSNLSSFHNGTELSHIDRDFLEKRDISIENREVLYQVISSQYSKTGLKIPENLKAIKSKRVHRGMNSDICAGRYPDLVQIVAFFFNV